MRTLQRNKGNLKYAKPLGTRPKTKTDAKGNVVKTGGSETYYSEPIDFKANIAMSGGEADMVEFGLNLTDYSAKIVADKGKIPLKEGFIIWNESEPQTDSEGHGIIDSADYIVVKSSPSPNVDKFVLQRLVNEKNN